MIGGSAAILASETGQRGVLTAQRGALWVSTPPDVDVFRINEQSASPQPFISLEALPSQPGDNTDPIAWILLAVGVVGITSASLLWTVWRRNRPPAPA